MSFAIVCWMLFCWVFSPLGSNPIKTIKQNAATPRAKVTSTNENAALSDDGCFMFERFSCRQLPSQSRSFELKHATFQLNHLVGRITFIVDTFLHHQQCQQPE